MLTPEEEKARALKVSQLYGKPLPNEVIKKPSEPFHWKPVMIAGVVLPLPIILANGIFSFYLLFSYTNLADVQAASILLIILLLGLLGSLLAAIHFFRQTLYSYYLGIHISFWLALAGLALISYGAFMVTQLHKSDTVAVIGVHSGLFAAVTIPISFIWSILIVFICDRLSRR